MMMAHVVDDPGSISSSGNVSSTPLYPDKLWSLLNLQSNEYVDWLLAT
jgi:hypothetical protein